MERYYSKNIQYEIEQSVKLDFTKFDTQILVHEKINASETSKSFIFNVLKAVKLQVELNCNYYVIKENVDYKLTPGESLYKVLCFGIQPEQIGFQIDHKKNIVIQTSEFSLIFGEFPEEYKSEQNKRLLWQSLKLLFT